jgi:exonuclease III
MNIILWNVRGLGRYEKRSEVRQLVKEKHLFILCIQETKMALVDAFICKSLWGEDTVDYSYQPSTGASGDLITMWDCKEVVVWATISFDHVLVIIGRFLKTNESFVLFNVYAPCDASGQQVLWENISLKMNSYVGQNICVCSDFNVVRCVEECRSVGMVSRQPGIANFNNFIDGCLFIDLPLRGRSFTWYRRDGRSMSRMDRFLLSEEWYLTCPNCVQTASTRGVSDHCPLQLSIDMVNWGPKPLRMLRCWEKFPGYTIFVRNQWNSFQVAGWGGYVLKEKFKLLKLALKDWHQQHSQNSPEKILSLTDKITTLDLKGESAVLVDEKIEELHGLSEELFSLSRINNSICWQQLRAQWLGEGDANTKFFHEIMSNRKRRNVVSSFLVNGVMVEGVENVCVAIYYNFSSHFKARVMERPSMAGLQFRSLSHAEGVGLVKLFSLDEVKSAVWDYDNYRCPGPDGISFGFIKDF